MKYLALLLLLLTPLTHAYEITSKHKLQDKKQQLTEISGMDASLKNEGIFWVHNDSGDKARLFSLDLQGNVLGELEVQDVRARDWESMASAPCGSDKCLYVADFGDNGRKRKDYQIHKIVEPKSYSGDMKTKAESYGFKYSTGKSHNAEGFAYNPKDGRFYIATKGYDALFILPNVLKDGMVAKELCKLDIKESRRKFITGLDFADDGRMLVRTYSGTHIFHEAGCGKSEYSDYGYREKQGETISYLGYGVDGFVTVSEGKNPIIYVLKNKKAKPPVVVKPPSKDLGSTISLTRDQDGNYKYKESDQVTNADRKKIRKEAKKKLKSKN